MAEAAFALRTRRLWWRPPLAVGCHWRLARQCPLRKVDTGLKMGFMSDKVTSRGFPDHHTLYLSVRPPRTAVFIQSEGDWMPIATRMLENFSRIWGGAGNILIPCSPDGNVNEIFWHILQVFDPDYLALYRVTYRDLMLHDPGKFERFVDKEVEQVTKQTSMSAQAARYLVTSDDYLDDPLFRGDLPSKVAERILRDLSPMSYGRQTAIEHWFQADCSPPYPYVDMAATPDGATERLALLDPTNLDPYLRLLLVSRTGALAPRHRKLVVERGTCIDELKVSTSPLAPLLEFSWHGAIDMPRLRARQELTKRIQELRKGSEGTNDYAVPWASEELASRTPLHQTLSGCGWFPQGDSAWDERPRSVVVGDSAGDFCLALALDRLFDMGVWAPQALIRGQDKRCSEFRTALADELRSAERNSRGTRDGGPLLTSLSLTEKESKSIRQRIDDAAIGRDRRIASSVKIVEPTLLELPRPRRILDLQLLTVPRVVPFVDRELVGTLDPVFPSHLNKEQQSDWKWCVDVVLDDRQLPARSCLSDLIMSERQRPVIQIRASSSCISYASRSAISFTGPPDHYTLVRPKLRLPSTREVFDKLLSQRGLRAEVSAAGHYTAQALDLWGGIDALAAALRDSNTNALLHAYLSTKPSEEEPGVFLTDPRRRYLSVEHADKVTDLDQRQIVDILDDYVGKGIMARGLILQCPDCRYAGWYALEDLRQYFRCARCRRNSIVSSQAWKKPKEEPHLYYELVEVVYQALDQDVRAPILALSALKGKSPTFMHCPEMGVFKPKNTAESPWVEMDLWAIVDGRITIGEAKTVNRLENTPNKEKTKIQKILKVAEAVTADRVVFATTAESWAEATRSEISKAFSDHRAKVQWLTGLG